MKQNAYPAYMVGLIICSYLFIASSIGHFQHGDDEFFKSAGISWAETGVFSAPELSGGLGMTNPPLEEIFFAYPPLYGLVFGLYTKLNGFGTIENQHFDIAIHATLLILTFLLSLQLIKLVSTKESPVSNYWGILPVVIVALFPQYGRPDELAMCFGVSSLLFSILLENNKFRPITVGLFLGLCIATSIGAGIAYTLVTIFFQIHKKISESVMELLKIGFVSGMTVLVVCMLTYGVKLYGLSQLIEVLFEHQTEVDTISGLKTMIRYAPHRVIIYSTILICTCFAFKPIFKKSINSWLLFCGGIWVFLVFVLLRVPHKATYLGFLSPFGLCIVAVVLGKLQSTHTPLYRLLCSAMIVFFLAASIFPIRGFLLRATLAEDQTPEYVQTRLNEIIPVGSTISAGAAYWAMARNRSTVYSSNWADSKHLELVDYIIFPGGGSGTPGKPNFGYIHSKKDYIDKHFDLIQNSISKSGASIFGIPLSRSGWGYGFALYKRKSDTVSN